MENEEEINNCESNNLDDTIFELRGEIEDLNWKFKVLLMLNFLLIFMMVCFYFILATFW